MLHSFDLADAERLDTAASNSKLDLTDTYIRACSFYILVVDWYLLVSFFYTLNAGMHMQ